MSVCTLSTASPLNDEQQVLWQKLAAFSFDSDPIRKPFSSRLAAENGWSESFTNRVLDEYRRFLFLTAVAGHKVCPSEEVDAAWHLHLIHSRSYWDSLCKGTLGYPLHHDPTAGGPDEFRKHWEMYERTLASYRRIFGAAPPSDIWPAAIDRFDPAAQPRTVNRRDHWILWKPRWLRGGIRRTTAVTLGVLPFAVGLGPLHLTGPGFLWLFFAMVVIGYVMVSIYSRTRRDMPVTSDHPLTAEEIACLESGRPAAVNAVVARMLHMRELASESTKSLFGLIKDVKFRAGPNPPPADQQLAQVIYQSVETRSLSLYELQTASAEETKAVEDNLKSNGYLLDDSQRRDIHLVAGLTMFVVLAFGITKIVIGLSRDRPVGFLILGCIAMVIVSVASFAFVRRTLAGDRSLEMLKIQNGDLKKGLDLHSISGEKIALSAALFGAAAFTDPVFSDFQAAWKNARQQGGWQSGSGCSGGAGCGGGGCGGGGCGGGGCGGCGGG